MSVSGSSGLRLGSMAWLPLALATMLPLSLWGQQTDVSVRGGFLSDSLKVGETTAYYLSARYPSSLTILFPDSTHGFSPFEYQYKEYFPTNTRDGISRDSSVYYLTTFEIDRVQRLSLPVYIAQPGDCTVVHTQRDSVLITQFIAQVPDTVSTEQLPLKANTAYEKVVYNINTILLVIVFTILLALGLVMWILFGKRVRRYFAARKLQRNHAAFINRYNALLAELNARFSPAATETAVVTWKEYMEQLEARPYTKLTTRETQRILKDPTVTQDLGKVDRAIYGHDTAVVDSLENLKTFADRQFQRKLKEVEHE